MEKFQENIAQAIKNIQIARKSIHTNKLLEKGQILKKDRRQIKHFLSNF